MTKTDILSGFDKIMAATKYEIDNQEYSELPYDITDSKITPIYEEFEAWKDDISNITDYSKLPNDLKKYINYIQNFTSTKISLISTGADRKAIVEN